MKALIVILLSSFSFASLATPELKGYPEELRQFLHPQKNTVTLNASAKEKAFTDKAIVSLVVSTEEDELAQAMTKNENIRQGILKQLLSAGLKASDVNNSKFSSSPQYGWFGDEPDSFEVINRVAIKVHNAEQFRLVAKLADQYKEVAFADTAFEHSEKEAFQEKVKRKVLSKIMAQKSEYESALGLKLKPISFHSPMLHHGGTRGARALEEKIVITGSRLKRTDDSDSNSLDYYAAKPRTNTKNSFDEIEYRAEISVIFEVIVD